MKAGTTWLHDYFAARGDVCLPAGIKETFFFNRHYDKGREWYGSHFRRYNAARHTRVLEVAPSYFSSRTAVPQRVSDTLGGIPLLAVLRNPVERSWSHYLHMLRYGLTRLPLQDAVREFPGILEASRYTKILSRWESMPGDSRVHLLYFDDLLDSPGQFADAVCKILKLEYRGLPPQSGTRSNEAAASPFPALVPAVQRAANALRSRRLYFILNAAKRAGLRSLFFGKPGDGKLPVMSESDRRLLNEMLGSELAYFEQKRDARPPDESRSAYNEKHQAHQSSG
jgi:hypothetical protein